MADGISEVNLNIGVDEKETFTNLFQEQYGMNMHSDFIEKKEAKKHNMKSHTTWLRDIIKINHEPEETIEINKWKICYVNFGMNIGTELNGIRPAIIFKNNDYKYGEDIVVLPITSYEDDNVIKSIDTFDIMLEADPNNGLEHRSLVKIRQMRTISKKRIRKDKQSGNRMIKGSIEDDEIRNKINSNVKAMLGI